ncbi:hypothetical protein SAICODRAFT_104705 [Saitoella complicata NRRL Y-17804]|uniref:uncharacterized protein n=1 Tax=Saitoella complicata (strain BCRC 22490 / CBS 7301 / JCM 7358 / NBRC 10748 / NRRL Y-17804) TaxID=698492 RepID=UPI0008670E27|nr:uncharacterized protein SAICODRAFT_104705 [Saitoella complicata NRRL Y-17804]ODQ56225.1 hypothetical protein SAICODRAFT_104705 [Saitoella complicata NRRL Y-17804]
MDMQLANSGPLSPARQRLESHDPVDRIRTIDCNDPSTGQPITATHYSQPPQTEHDQYFRNQDEMTGYVIRQCSKKRWNMPVDNGEILFLDTRRLPQSEYGTRMYVLYLKLQAQMREESKVDALMDEIEGTLRVG